MSLISVALILFIILESLNVVCMYCFPDLKKGNSISSFNAYEKAKQDPEMFIFIKYLVNWVAGTKFIFILLLVVILVIGSDIVKLVSTIALILSISTFYWKLYPLIKNMDQHNQINPKGYSKTLRITISVFILMFLIAIISYFIKINV